MADLIAAALLILGFAMIVAGFWLLHPAIGLIASGVVCIGLAQLMASFSND